MENCRAEGRYWAKKIMKWYLTWICSDKEKINLFCFIHCVGKWEGGESARLNWWVWLLPLQACSRFDYNPTISQIHKYQISPMILTAQSLTRSSCLNSALRDDEAVYRVCKGHYEAVAVGGSVEGICAFIYWAKWRSGQVLPMPFSLTHSQQGCTPRPAPPRPREK